MEPYLVLHSDPRLVVVDKLANLPAAPDPTGDISVRSLVAEKFGCAFLEAPHRLDRRVTGALAFARSAQAAAALSEAFRLRRVRKTYLAVVERAPESESCVLVHRLRHDGRRNVSRVETVDPKLASAWEGDARAGRAVPPEIAVLAWRRAALSEHYALVEVELLTGRHHQVRAQLAAGLSPIRGDLKYGARRSCRNGLVMLHAWKLSLPPVGKTAALELEAPLPADEPLWSAFPGYPIARADNPASM
ncbi:MAG: RNA pseudouridine synthase [Spirochaetales bacterium]|nr:RNA pseudouridine synthase [Spirochaetales bacterium]